MIMNKRSNQGGSTITFIIVAIVLFFVLAGAVQYVKTRGEVARKEQSIVNVDDGSESTNETTGDSGAATGELQTQEATSSEVASNVNSGPQVTQVVVASATSPSANTSSSATSTTNQSTTKSSATLPQGGPNGLIGDVMAVFAISTSSAMYFVSTRKIKTSL